MSTATTLANCMRDGSGGMGERRSAESSPQNEDLKTGAVIATEHGVSHATVERAATYAKDIDTLAALI